MKSLMKPVVLVDFDGVVVRGKSHSNFVQQRVNQYLVDHVKIPKQHVREVNAELYNGWGHTWYGLKSMGWKENIANFNKHVYSDLPDHKDELTLNDDEKKEWDQFVGAVHQMDYDVQMFSNSPLLWMTTCMGLDPNDQLFDLHNEINALKCDRYLKPNRDVYHYIMSKYKKRPIFFIDDKLKNFEHVMDHPKWINMWMTEEQMRPHIRRNLWNVGDFDDCIQIINNHLWPAK